MAAVLGRAVSNTFLGTAFEERCLRVLQTQLSMSLERVGGPSDGGIDLQGWWWVPPPGLGSEPVLRTGGECQDPERRRLRIIAQCKAEKKPLPPRYIRELEGVLYRYQAEPGNALHRHRSVAMLVSQSAFTKQTLARAMSSPIPFFLLHLPPTSHKPDELPNSVVWNYALGGGGGLFGGNMEIRWEYSAEGGGRPGLWWKGVKLENWVPVR